MPSIPVSDLRQGMVIEKDDKPWLILAVWPHSGGWVLQVEVRLRNLWNGRVQDGRLRYKDIVEVLPVTERVMQFVCRQQDELLFVEPDSGELLAIPDMDYLRDGLSGLAPDSPARVTFFQDRPIWARAL